MTRREKKARKREQRFYNIDWRIMDILMQQVDEITARVCG